MKFNAAKCDCGYMAATPEEHPKCPHCGKDMRIFERGSPEYNEIDVAIRNFFRPARA